MIKFKNILYIYFIGILILIPFYFLCFVDGNYNSEIYLLVFCSANLFLKMELKINNDEFEEFDETNNGKYGNPENIIRLNQESFQFKMYILSNGENQFCCKLIHGKVQGISRLLSKNLQFYNLKDSIISIIEPKEIKEAKKVSFKVLTKVKHPFFTDQAIDILKITGSYIYISHIQKIYILEHEFLIQIVDIESFDKNIIYKITEKTKFKEIKDIIIEDKYLKEKVKNDFPGYNSLVDEFIDILESSKNIENRINGIIISGESGSGKSKLMTSIIQHLKWNSIEVNSSTIFQENIGDAEKYLNEIFQKAKMEQDKCILLFDNFDLISNPKGQIRKQVLHEFLYLMRYIKNFKDPYICVIGMTDDFESIDKRLLDPDIFGKIFELKVPTEKSRLEISKYILKDFKVKNESEILHFLNEKTQGFIAKDIHRLIVESYLNAKERNDDIINLDDFRKASLFVKPSILSKSYFRPVKSTITLNDLAGIDDIKERIHQSILHPMRNYEKYIEIGIQPPKGVLLYGESGTGKTMIAQAIANEVKANFVAIQSTDILSKYVGESSKTISQIFKQARASAPCILFFDQFESIARVRGDDSSTSQSNDRMLSTLLIEMDGIIGKNDKQILILAATNRKDLLDVSILRPGRLDQHIEFKIPNEKSRLEILKLKFKNRKLDDSVDLLELSKMIKGFSGSEIDQLCKESHLNSLRESSSNPIIKRKHIEEAYKILKG